MKEYLAMCLEGPASIPQRKEMLSVKQRDLIKEMQILQEGLDYIDWKQHFYDDVVSGKIPYKSNLIKSENEL